MRCLILYLHFFVGLKYVDLADLNSFSVAVKLKSLRHYVGIFSSLVINEVTKSGDLLQFRNETFLRFFDRIILS